MQGDDLFIGITSLAVLMRGAMYGCEREPRLGIAWIAAQLRLQLRKACRRGTACGLWCAARGGIGRRRRGLNTHVGHGGSGRRRLVCPGAARVSMSALELVRLGEQGPVRIRTAVARQARLESLDGGVHGLGGGPACCSAVAGGCHGAGRWRDRRMMWAEGEVDDQRERGKGCATAAGDRVAAPVCAACARGNPQRQDYNSYHCAEQGTCDEPNGSDDSTPRRARRDTHLQAPPTIHTCETCVTLCRVTDSDARRVSLTTDIRA